jgi:hypothetical protein
MKADIMKRSGVFSSGGSYSGNNFPQTFHPGDLSQSTAVGFTINHISAVVIPLIGGSLWLLNWQLPFIIGACLTVVSLFFTQKIKAHPH